MTDKHWLPRDRAAPGVCATRLLGSRRFDLEPDDIALSPASDLALDRLEMRPAALVVQVEIRVAREADDARFTDLLPGKELRQVRPDDFLEQHKRETRGIRDADQPRQAGRDLHDREPRIGLSWRRLENHDEIEAERREQRKRARKVDRERCQHWQHGFAKKRAQGYRISKAFEGHEPDLALGEGRQQLARREIVEGRHELVASASHGLQLQGRSESGQIDRRVGLREQPPRGRPLES